MDFIKCFTDEKGRLASKCVNDDYDFSLAYKAIRAFLTLANSEGEIVFQTAKDAAYLIDACRAVWNIEATSDRSYWRKFRGNYHEHYSNFDGSIIVSEIEDPESWEVYVIYRNSGDYENYHVAECRFIVSPNGEGYTLESFRSAMKQVNRDGLEKPNYLASDEGFVKVS